MRIEIVQKDSPDLRNPIILCALPGSALVGKLAIDHLIGELKANLLAEVLCDGLAPQVIIRENGTVSMMRNEIFYWRNPIRNARDIVFYTADSQPSSTESEYALSESIVKFLKENFGSRELVTLGAFVTGKSVKDPKIFAAATEERLLASILKSGCRIMDAGAITGMNGLLLGVAKAFGVRGYTLLGETSGYLFDPRASEAVLVCLSKIEGVTVSMQKLRERAHEAEALLRSIERSRAQGTPGGQRLNPGQQNQEEPEASDRKKRLDYIS